MPAVHDVTNSAIATTSDQWLASLPGPSLFTIPGRNPGSGRVISVLLHGNEPSGFRAVHRYLKEERRPARETLVLIGAVDAAKTEPLFSHRFSPGRRDLNRCFVDISDDVDGAIAAQYLRHIKAFAPGSLVDLHNNTGHNPAYGVLFDTEPCDLALVELFASKSVVTDLRLGTLIEALPDDVAAAVIECGQAGANLADEVAYRGLCRYLEDESLPAAPSHELSLFRATHRVVLRPDADIVFAEEGRHHAHADSELVLVSHIEDYNFRPIPAGHVLGSVNGTKNPITVIDTNGADHSDVYFENRDGKLVVRKSFTPIMMTASAEVAKQDCVGYLVAPLPETQK